MAQKTINPYPNLGAQFIAGLNAIISVPITSVDVLVNAVANYVESVYYPAGLSSVQKVEVKSVAYSAVDSYLDGLLRNPATNLYNSKQSSIIKMLAGPPMTSFLAVDEISDRISDIEDNLTLCGLNVENQTPLFFATMIGVNAYNYWLAQIALGGASAWHGYFNTAKVSAMGNVPFWTAAAMEGALIGSRSTNNGMIEPSDSIIGVEIISALTAALTIAVGRVVYGWIPMLNISYFNPVNPNSNIDSSNLRMFILKENTRSLQNEIFSSLSPEQKANVWSDKMNQVTNLKIWSTKQINLISEIMSFITPNLYIKGSFEYNNFVDFEKNWKLKAQSHFPKITLQHMLTSYNNLPPNGVPQYEPWSEAGDCECSVAHDWCSGNTESCQTCVCGGTSWGCGAFCVFSCDGMCLGNSNDSGNGINYNQ